MAALRRAPVPNASSPAQADDLADAAAHARARRSCCGSPLPLIMKMMFAASILVAVSRLVKPISYSLGGEIPQYENEPTLDDDAVPVDSSPTNSGPVRLLSLPLDSSLFPGDGNAVANVQSKCFVPHEKWGDFRTHWGLQRVARAQYLGEGDLLVYPNVYVAPGCAAVTDRDVVPVTHMTVDRLPALKLLAKRWAGAEAAGACISLAVLLCNESDFDKLVSEFQSSALLSGIVSVHVVLGKSSKYPFNVMRNAALEPWNSAFAPELLAVRPPEAIARSVRAHTVALSRLLRSLGDRRKLERTPPLSLSPGQMFTDATPPSTSSTAEERGGMIRPRGGGQAIRAPQQQPRLLTTNGQPRLLSPNGARPAPVFAADTAIAAATTAKVTTPTRAFVGALARFFNRHRYTSERDAPVATSHGTTNAMGDGTSNATVLVFSRCGLSEIIREMAFAWTTADCLGRQTKAFYSVKETSHTGGFSAESDAAAAAEALRPPSRRLSERSSNRRSSAAVAPQTPLARPWMFTIDADALPSGDAPEFRRVMAAAEKAEFGDEDVGNALAGPSSPDSRRNGVARLRRLYSVMSFEPTSKSEFDAFVLTDPSDARAMHDEWLNGMYTARKVKVFSWYTRGAYKGTVPVRSWVTAKASSASSSTYAGPSAVDVEYMPKHEPYFLTKVSATYTARDCISLHNIHNIY